MTILSGVSFVQGLSEARQRGFITGRLHVFDSTHIAAKVDLFRPKQERDDNDDTYLDGRSPDLDACFET